MTALASRIHGSSPAHEGWLLAAAWSSLLVAGGIAAFIAIDVLGRRQRMAVMNVVWPLTALYSGLLGLLAYLDFGRAREPSPESADRPAPRAKRPRWQSTLLAASHCGAGCMVGDVLADTTLFVTGSERVIAGSALLTSYVFDFGAAYVVGIAFQYFSLVPMRHLGPVEGLIAAIKADTFSLVAFQVGMYAWMAVFQLVLFRPRLDASSPVFWLMMQVGMLAGLATAYPMNRWLVRRGLKEAM